MIFKGPKDLGVAKDAGRCCFCEREAVILEFSTLPVLRVKMLYFIRKYSHGDNITTESKQGW